MLQKQELLQIRGGAFKWTGAFLQQALKWVDKILDIGRTIGSAYRRIGAKCPLN